MFAQDEDVPAGKNIVKLNVAAIGLKNLSAQYERILNKKLSIGVGLRYMPMTQLPFKATLQDKVLKQYEGWQSYGDIKFDLSNYAVTPEFRYYFGRGYGRGLYLASFVRYARYTVNSEVHYDVTYKGQQFAETIPVNGNFTTITGGLMLGAQWKLYKSLYLDWWILGPQYGAVNGTFIGTRNLDNDEQEAVRIAANQYDIPYMNKSVEVSSSGMRLTVNGPWTGVRAGLCLGIRF
jgi:hypothetical protein